VVFIEVGDTSRNEGESREEDPHKWEFELRNDESNSQEEAESIELDEEVEHQNLILRRCDHVRRQYDRYSPPDFYYTFSLFVSDEEPRSIKEVVNL
jgi:hypothetical protein